METTVPLISFCIPTNGRPDYVGPLLSSIYSQGVDESLFEVIVSDNAGSPGLEKMVAEMEKANLRYYRSYAAAQDNQLDALEQGGGVFCKMLNHRCIMLPGSIEELIALVRKYRDSSPVIYCSNGVIKAEETTECPDTDTFVRTLSYWCSWSAGTSVWAEDLKDMRSKPFDADFPHVLFLFDTGKDRYVIWNKKYHGLQDDAGKGGYNFFEVFAIRLMDIFRGLLQEGRISDGTFRKVKEDNASFLKEMFFKECVYPTRHTYILTGIRKSVSVYYGKGFYLSMVLYSIFVAPIRLIVNKFKKMLFFL